MNMPYFSVIVPVYNVERYLKQCIDSILCQTFQNFELILVDDGSKDRSPAMCDAYSMQDGRVRVIHKPNGGVVSARKAGLRQSCGCYIVHVDSDDYLAADYLAHFYEIIQKTGADIITSKFMSVTEDGQPMCVAEHALEEGLYAGKQIESIYRKLMYDFEKPFHNDGCFRWSVWAKTVKRELIEAAQLAVPDEIRNGEDCAVMIPAVCRAASLYVSNYCGYHYRQVGSSMVHTFNPREAESLCVLLDYMCGLNLPIPSKNIIGFSARILWGQTLKAVKALDSVTTLRRHMKQGNGKIIAVVLQGMKQEKMTAGIKLRMLPIQYRLWWLLWLFYHK